MNCVRPRSPRPDRGAVGLAALTRRVFEVGDQSLSGCRRAVVRSCFREESGQHAVVSHVLITSPRRYLREEDVSTIESAAQTEPWFPRAHGHTGWPQHHSPPQTEGPQAPVSITLGGDEPVVPGLYAFPRDERLTRRQDYLRIYRHGQKRVGRAFIVYGLRQPEQGRKFGFAVSRKTGKAVTRNRIKRYLREFYRTHRAQLPEDLHLVVVARPAAAAMRFDECREALSRLLTEGGFWGA